MTDRNTLMLLIHVLSYLWSLSICIVTLWGILYSHFNRFFFYTRANLVLFVVENIQNLKLWNYQYQLVKSGEYFVYSKGNIETYVIYFAFLLSFTLIVLLTLYECMKHTGNRITVSSIKHAFDSLPTGLIGWNKDNRILFLNSVMKEIIEEVTHKPFYNMHGLEELLCDRTVYMNDGRVFELKRSTGFDSGVEINELIAYDVTEIHNQNILLKEKQDTLQKFNESLRSYNIEINELVRKNEILEAKRRIHDGMNMLMLRSRAACENDRDQEFSFLFDKWKNHAILLGKNDVRSKENDPFAEIRKSAEILGVTFHLNNIDLSACRQSVKEIIACAANEALANVMKHTSKRELTIRMDCQDESIDICFENQLDQDSVQVKLGGGLTNLKNIVEDENGTMSIKTENGIFCVKLHFTL